MGHGKGLLRKIRKPGQLLDGVFFLHPDIPKPLSTCGVCVSKKMPAAVAVMSMVRT